VLFGLAPEDRFASLDRLINAGGAAHLSGSLEHGKDLRRGRWMPTKPAAGLNSEDRRLDERPLGDGRRQWRYRDAIE
jgi:hypothetical protein